MRNDISSVSTDLEAKLATLTEKEEELQILRSCLSQVTEQAAATATATNTADNDVTDGGVSPSPSGGGEAVDGEQDGETVGEKKQQAQLEKIQAMLDTTKVKKKTVGRMNFCVCEFLDEPLVFLSSGSAGAA